jgi:hypothetical protein
MGLPASQAWLSSDSEKHESKMNIPLMWYCMKKWLGIGIGDEKQTSSPYKNINL